MISADSLSLSYGTQHLLKGVTFAVGAGEKVGMVGRNGCGKTSLLKILAGAQEADSGEVSRKREWRIGYLPQEFELDDTTTVRENILGGVADVVDALARYESGEGSDRELADCLHLIETADGWTLDSRIKADATALGVPPMDTVTGTLSGGEKRRVALCRALVAQPDLLLLDEPTNHLDAESTQWLEDYLRSFPGALIFVTHDRYFLEVIASRIIEIADGRAFSHPGNYTAYLEAKAIRQQVAEQSERRRQRFIRAELEYVRAGVRAQRSKSRHRLDTFYQIAGQDAPPEEREMDLLLPPPPELGNVAIELKDAGACVETEDGLRWLFDGLNLSIKPGECTGVVGRNGVGKTTLLRLCLGERAADQGAVTIGKRVVFNYIDQGRMKLDGSRTLIEEVADGGGEMISFGEQRLGVRAYLRRFLFNEDRVRERVDTLSGGERARLLLAKVLKRGGNVIVLDEPTNDLDLASLRMLEEALAAFGGCVLLVSHDRYFLDRVCDQIVAFEDNGVFVQPGNYSYYLEKRKEREKTARRPIAESSPKASMPPEPAPRRRKRTFREQQEWESMEETILAAEARVAGIEATLNEPSFYVERAHEAAGLIREVEKGKADIAWLYQRWEELEQLA